MISKNSELSVNITEIYDTMYRLGVTANYIGFFHASYAVYLAAHQPQLLLMITKWLYPKVAKHYNTSNQAVERNIRTIINIIWNKNRPLLEELAKCRLRQKPKNAQFLAILAAHFSSGAAA